MNLLEAKSVPRAHSGHFPDASTRLTESAETRGVPDLESGCGARRNVSGPGRVSSFQADTHPVVRTHRVGGTAPAPHCAVDRLGLPKRVISAGASG